MKLTSRNLEPPAVVATRRILDSRVARIAELEWAVAVERGRLIASSAAGPSTSLPPAVPNGAHDPSRPPAVTLLRRLLVRVAVALSLALYVAATVVLVGPATDSAARPLAPSTLGPPLAQRLPRTAFGVIEVWSDDDQEEVKATLDAKVVQHGVVVPTGTHVAHVSVTRGDRLVTRDERVDVRPGAVTIFHAPAPPKPFICQLPVVRVRRR